MCAHFLRFDVRSTLLIFSFNDTATTEIYTLSLHDALPISGWATSFVNGGTCTQGSNWTTVTNMVATSPNAAFHNDPTCVTDNYLVSPSINITSGTAVLDFRNAFNLESGFDGGVLEVSTDGGTTFADI